MKSEEDFLLQRLELPRLPLAPLGVLAVLVVQAVPAAQANKAEVQAKVPHPHHPVKQDRVGRMVWFHFSAAHPHVGSYGSRNGLSHSGGSSIKICQVKI